MKNRLLLVDYSCHPFSLQLAKSLAKKNIKVFYVFSKNVNLTGSYYKNVKDQNLKIIPIKTKDFYKYNFFKRRSSEIEFATYLIKILKKNKINKAILANLPIDPLYRLIKYCKKNDIKNYFWVQDIYNIAIRNVLKQNKFIYSIFGYFVSNYYRYLENYCYLNATKNIVIDKNFKNFFPKRNQVYEIRNWVPNNLRKNLIKKEIIYKRLKIKKRFTFIYTGTLSYKHHFRNILKLAKDNQDSQILIFSNDKFILNMKKETKLQNINNIYFFKTISYDMLSSYINIADVGLVNLTLEANNLCVPSKVLTYYSNYLPVLASMPISNLASRNILKYKTGFVSNPSNTKKYLSNAKLIKENDKLRFKLSNNCRHYANKEFNIKRISQNFINILNNKQA